MINHIGTKELKTKRLLLRKIKEEDYKDVFRYASKEEVSKYVTWDTHKDINETKALCKMWEEQYKNEDKYHWAIVYNNTVIGNIEIVKLVDDTAFIGWQVDSDYWNKGIMTESATAVRDYMFGKVGIERLNASFIKDNVGSGRVMEKIGMKPISPQKYYEKLSDTKNHQLEVDGMPLAFYSIAKDEWIELCINLIDISDFEKLSNIWDLKKCSFTQQFKDELLRNNRSIFVLQINNDFIAECDFVFSKEEIGYTIKDKRIYLSRLMVKKEYRNTGLGQAMLAFMIKKAKNMGYSEISVGVDTDNLTALHIYKKTGFKEFEKTYDEYGQYYKMIFKIK